MRLALAVGATGGRGGGIIPYRAAPADSLAGEGEAPNPTTAFARDLSPSIQVRPKLAFGRTGRRVRENKETVVY